MNKVSRRNVLAGLSGGLAATLAIAGRADAAQPHMEAALDALKTAERELKDANPDKGGHRGKAIQIVKNAIAEVERGIQYAKTH
jgi:hypothetical protein